MNVSNLVSFLKSVLSEAPVGPRDSRHKLDWPLMKGDAGRQVSSWSKVQGGAKMKKDLNLCESGIEAKKNTLRW